MNGYSTTVEIHENQICISGVNGCEKSANATSKYYSFELINPKLNLMEFKFTFSITRYDTKKVSLI